MYTPSTSSPAALHTSPTVLALERRQRDSQPQPRPRSISKVTPSNVSQVEAENISSQVAVGRGKARPKAAENVVTEGLTPVVQGIQLRSTSELPDRLRSVFKFPIFNAIQSKCLPCAFGSDDNLIVSAPTGSGKTVIMELAICRLIMQAQGQDFKVVYQAPTKSLCSERYNDWQKKFGALSLECAELTGDTDYDHLRSVQKASIIITTPEKWDSVTRKWKDHAKLMRIVKLFLVDEVHILKDERGATLEAVVSRMKSAVTSIRFVALSATVPNSDDIAVWLGKGPTTQHLPARREVFGENFRPVQLEKHVYGYEGRANGFAFDSMLTQQ
jgi:ATP-dependent DNA helicase HFM1/MER3